MKTPRHFAPVAFAGLVALAALAPACSDGFARIGPSASLVVAITAGNTGAPTSRLPIPLGQPAAYTVDVEAHRPDGSIDTSFNGFVRASVKPGTVGAVTPVDPKSGIVTDGRNVQLVNGVARGVTVNVAAAYGDARIWFEDIGYAPADILRNPPPQCSNGIDDNGNGTIDFPADPGCAFANDDSEELGTFATGVSQSIYFLSPRISDVRGRGMDPMGTPTGGSVTNFPHEQVQVDTGWRGSDFAFWTLVTRVSADGFYLSDLQNDLVPRDPNPNILPDPNTVPGYGSVFAFTFSTPPKMRVCDRFKLFGGTASDFHGFTEIGFPTWLLEEWDPTVRPCGVPEPHSISPGDLANPDLLFKLESSLVRIESVNNWTIHVAKHFGPTLLTAEADGSYKPTEAASNCDFNHNGKVDFDGGAENICSCYCDGCSSDPRNPNASPAIPIAGDPECSEYSQYSGHNEFKLVINFQIDPMNLSQLKIQVDGSSSALFDPLAIRGQPIRSFTGTFRYFSGGSQFTIEARCDDDIVVDPLANPFCSDAGFEKRLSFCTTLDATPLPTSGTVPYANRRLACVHARSISDNNESSH